MANTRRSSWAAVALLLAATMLVTGCMAEDRQMAADFFMTYFKDKYGTPANMVKYVMYGGTTKDPEADAALGAGIAISSIQKADNLAQGSDLFAQEGKLDKAEEYIKKAMDTRPNDYIYMVKLGGLEYEKGMYHESNMKKMAMDDVMRACIDPKMSTRETLLLTTAALEELQVTQAIVKMRVESGALPLTPEKWQRLNRDLEIQMRDFFSVRAMASKKMGDMTMYASDINSKAILDAKISASGY